MIKWLEEVIRMCVARFTKNEAVLKQTDVGCKVRHDWQATEKRSEWDIYRHTTFKVNGVIKRVNMILPDKYSPSAYLENRVCMRCLKVEKQIEDFEKKLIMMCVDTMNRIQKAEEIMLKSKGFTLIELLIVCAIISILVAIVVPQVSRYTKQVHLTCVSNSGRVLFDGPAKHVVSGGTNGTEWKFETLDGEKLRLNGQCVEKIVEKADANYRSLN